MNNTHDVLYYIIFAWVDDCIYTSKPSGKDASQTPQGVLNDTYLHLYFYVDNPGLDRTPTEQQNYMVSLQELLKIVLLYYA